MTVGTRQTRRMVIRIVVSVILGAIWTVAFGFGAEFFYSTRWRHVVSAPHQSWPSQPPDGWPRSAEIWHSTGSSLGSTFNMWDDRADHEWTRESSGFPFRVLRVDRWYHNLRRESLRQVLGTGLVLSTLSWAALAIAVWSVPDAVKAIRGHRRRARGRCPACGYDLKGASSAICPECGT